MYYILFIVIAVVFFLELKTQKVQKNLFNVIYLLMTAVAVFRFGQGTDYFNYLTIYDASAELNSWVFEKDIGFAFLCHFFVNLGMPYPYFSGLIAFLTMAALYPFFSKICNKSLFPLFIFYAYLYLIYPLSGIRQGLTIAILLGIMYPLLISRKYFYYYVVLLIASTIHLSTIICAVLPFLMSLDIKKKTLWILVGVFTVVMFLNLNLSSLIPSLLDRAQDYSDSASSSYNIVSKIFRLLIIIMILSMSDSKLEVDVKKVRNVVVFGYVFYSALAFSDILAGRIETYFRVFEMILIFMLAYKTTKKAYFRPYIFLFFLLYTPLWFKNIQSQIDQGEYMEKSIISYPYISIFQPDDIRMYRKNYYYDDLY